MQKWELFAACLEHLLLVIGALQPGMVQAQVGSQAAPPPGLSVMMELLREPSSLQACCSYSHQSVYKVAEHKTDTSKEDDFEQLLECLLWYLFMLHRVTSCLSLSLVRTLSCASHLSMWCITDVAGSKLQ